MKTISTVCLMILFILSGTTGVFAQDDMVDVTFRANTATWSDTLGENGLVQIRGQIANVEPPSELSEGVTIDWSAATTMYLTNVEGDYWEGTFQIPEGTKLVYKFFVNAQHETVAPGDPHEHEGWEDNISDGIDDDGESPGNNRLLDLTDAEADTVLPLQFVNGIGHGDIGQYEKPYEEIDGTFGVYLRVNMAGWEEFDPEGHVVGVRGSNMDDWGPTGQINWDETYPLNREGSTFFYSNVVNVPDTHATSGLQFKFVVHDEGAPLDEHWDDMRYNPDTEYQITTTGQDTTVYWKWFDNLEPIAVDHEDTLIVTFQADMSQSLAEGAFSHGDELEVRAGYAGSAEQLQTKRMTRIGLGNVYFATDTLVGAIGEELIYQYYLMEDGQEFREIYFDFDFPDPGDAIAERRRVLIPTAEYTVADIEDDITSPRRLPRFRNTNNLSQDVTVTVNLDVRPAIYQILAGDVLEDIQGNIDIDHPDSVITMGLFINGPMSGGWQTWGLTLRNDETRTMEYAGDSVFTIEIELTTEDLVGQEFKFGIGGGDNESGFGLNHIENIDDSESTYTLNVQFGSIYPTFYTAWDYDQGVPVSVDDTQRTPITFELMQNYPNPFNPATTIQYSIAETEKVELTIYNVLGQQVVTLVNEVQNPGTYQATFDASHLSSGVYIYRIQAGDFVESKRMMFIK